MLRPQRFTRGIPPQHPPGLASGARRLHYAWVMVAVASLLCMLSSPMRFAISLLVPHLQHPAGFGWSYFAISGAFALQWLCSALFSPLVGWLLTLSWGRAQRGREECRHEAIRWWTYPCMMLVTLGMTCFRKPVMHTTEKLRLQAIATPVRWVIES